MTEGYIVEVSRYLRNDSEDCQFIVDDTVFINLNDAIERSRKLYNEYCESANKLVRPFDECYFNDKTGKFFIFELFESYYAEASIKKVSIDSGNTKR